MLVPVDASEASLEAVSAAVAVARRYDARVHALYVLAETGALGLRTGDVPPEEIADRCGDVMEAVASVAGDLRLSHSSACAFSVDRLSQHPGSVVLDVAETVDADVVVVPREPDPEDPAAVIEKAAEYVIAHASQPVLSV